MHFIEKQNCEILKKKQAGLDLESSNHKEREMTTEIEMSPSPSPSPSRMLSEGEMATVREKMTALTTSFCTSLDAVKAKEREAALLRGKLPKLESSLREAENEFVEVIRVKTRSEAKQVEFKEKISAKRARIEELKRITQVQSARRDEYREAVSKISLADDTKESQNSGRKEEIQEAILWYNKVLGVQIDSGRGVKFTFNSIDPKNLHVEYAFTIRYADDKYTLLACDPELSGTEELVRELNRTNGLYGFVRTMRLKFQETALLGCAPKSIQQELSAVSTSVRGCSFSTDGSETPNDEHLEEGKRRLKKGRYGVGAKEMRSPLAVRSSPRLKARKQ